LLREPLLQPTELNPLIEETRAAADSKHAQRVAVELRLDLLNNIVTMLNGELKKLKNDANLTDNLRSFDFPVSMRELVADYECRLIREALNATKNRQNRAAELLGVKPTTLNSKIQKYKMMD